jgi:hypothetical protein
MKRKAITLIFGLCLAASLASAATIEGSTIANNQITISGSFALPIISVTLGTSSLTVVSSSSTQVVATVSPLPHVGTYRLVVHDNAGSNISTATVSPITLTGYVNSNGTVNSGTGFTVTLVETGTYKVSWPAGTFQCCGPLPSFYANNTFGQPIGNIQYVSFSGDGSGSFGITFNGVDTFFNFSMTQTF